MKVMVSMASALLVGATAHAGLSESFDTSGLPSGWTSVDVLQVGGPSAALGWDTNDNILDGGIARGNIATGNTFSIVADSDAIGSALSGAYDLALESPSFLVDGANSILQFEHLYRQLSTSSTTEQASVEITNDAGANWTPLVTYSSSQFGTFANVDPSVDADAGTLESLDLSSYLGDTVQVRFRFTDTNFNAWNWYWQIDDIQTVPVPGALTLLGLAGLATRRRRR